MKENENNSIESIIDSVMPDLMNFLTDIDLQLAFKEFLGFCPLEVAYCLTKDFQERKKED